MDGSEYELAMVDFVVDCVVVVGRLLALLHMDGVECLSNHDAVDPYTFDLVLDPAVLIFLFEFGKGQFEGFLQVSVEMDLIVLCSSCAHILTKYYRIA